jgi:hypothetical protein
MSYQDFEEKKIKLIIPLASYRKLIAYVDLCKDEVSGFAKVEYDEERVAFVMGEVYLVKQEASCGNTEMGADEIATFNHELVKRGVRQLPRLWWHSHAGMGVFWSSTDEDTMANLKNDSYMLALETNHEHKFICRLIIWKPFTFVQSLPVDLDVSYQRIPQYLAKEVEKKVKVTSFAYQKEDKLAQYNWSPKKKGPASYNSLPKDKEKALDKVVKLGLVEVWNEKVKDFVWENPKNGDVWLDTYEVLVIARFPYND